MFFKNITNHHGSVGLLCLTIYLSTKHQLTFLHKLRERACTEQLLFRPVSAPYFVQHELNEAFRLVAAPTKQELSRYELSECFFYLNKVKRYQIRNQTDIFIHKKLRNEKVFIC